MLGAFIEAEVSNPDCPWGGSYNNLQLAQNIENNLFQMNKLIELANEYPNIIFSLSVGNEACVDWTDHLVPVESVIKYVEDGKEFNFTTCDILRKLCAMVR
jgi:hypothetical protein